MKTNKKFIYIMGLLILSSFSVSFAKQYSKPDLQQYIKRRSLPKNVSSDAMIEHSPENDRKAIGKNLADIELEKTQENKPNTPQAAAPSKEALKPFSIRKSYYVYDPLEGFNRRVYYFNYGLDKYFIIPVTKAYVFITPKPIQKGVSNFFRNNDMIKSTANSLLQGKIKKAMRAVGRFTMNATVGLGGTLDTASKMGMPTPHEDFGMTLAHYGIKSGPYLILPVLGPSNLRDAVGTGVDSYSKRFMDPYEAAQLFDYDSIGITALNGVNTRSKIPFTYYSTGSPFEYEYVRLLLTKYREMQIRAANLPEAPKIKDYNKKEL